MVPKMLILLVQERVCGMSNNGRATMENSEN
jgi:hypothetical protein